MKSQKTKLREAETNKAWYQANRNHALSKSKEYQAANKDKVKAYQRAYRLKRYSEDAQYRLACILRARLGGAIKNTQKAGSAVKDLGCSISELITHIESKFTNGMSWDNYGEWEIDHIKPLSKFDLTSTIEFAEACHYSNLQPLWEKENIRKSDGQNIQHSGHSRGDQPTEETLGGSDDESQS